MKNVIYYGIIAIILISSCKKEAEEVLAESELPTIKTVDYTALSIGNYWVYETFSIDSLNNATSLSKIDSIVVDRDTVIGGNTYYVLEGTNYPTMQNWGIVDIIRDSSDYLVNASGRILFSKSNFSQVLSEKIEIYNSDTLYTLKYQMEITNGSINVPAGTFNDVYNYKGTLLTYIPANVSNPRYLDNYYAPDIGKIIESYAYLNHPNIFQKRLINYYIP